MFSKTDTDHTEFTKPILNKIWSLFDILRNEPITSEDYDIILLLISAYKDGFLDNNLLWSPMVIKERIAQNLWTADGEFTKNEYTVIYSSFHHTLERLTIEGLYNIVQLIGNIDIQVLKRYFSYFFDAVLYRMAQSQGRLGGEYLQPIELTRLIYNLADLPKNATVYNPFAGVASFGVFLTDSQSYFGQEINKRTWAIGALRLLAFNKHKTSIYVNDDSIHYWPDKSNKFDLIVSNPPFGLKLNNNYRGSASKFRNAEWFLVENGIESLSENGKLIAILPNGFFFRGGPEERLRKYLIESDLIEAIISFPGGLLLNTGMPLVLLVLNRAKKKPGYVKFIDAKEHVETTGSRDKRLNDNTLYSIINNNITSGKIKTIPIQHIRDLEYNLSVPRYFQKEIEGTKLSEILEYVRGSHNKNSKFGKLIRIRDLKQDKLDYTLDTSIVEDTSLNRPNIRVIEQTVLLLAVRWKTLKPTLFVYQGTPIYLSNDILAFKINQPLADITYIANELQSEYVHEQLESYRIGGPIPFLRRNDLLEIKVRLPSLKEQIAKVQGLEELSKNIKSLQKERNDLAHGRLNSRFNEFASLKHTLGRPRQNILDWSDNLIHFLDGKNKEVDKLNKTFADFYGIGIIDALKEVKRDINYMSAILEKGENGLVVDQYPLQLVSLSDINALVSEVTYSGFNFNLKRLFIKGDKIKELGIESNPILLKALIDNILTNANKHGFISKDSSNEMVIELIEVEDNLIIELKNNGKPFPKNFNKEKFISKYSTGNPQIGSGLGGYDINRIAEYFNNQNWELILNEDPIYPVKFKFQFPIKLVK